MTCNNGLGWIKGTKKKGGGNNINLFQVTMET